MAILTSLLPHTLFRGMNPTATGRCHVDMLTGPSYVPGTPTLQSPPPLTPPLISKSSLALPRVRATTTSDDNVPPLPDSQEVRSFSSPCVGSKSASASTTPDAGRIQPATQIARYRQNSDRGYGPPRKQSLSQVPPTVDSNQAMHRQDALATERHRPRKSPAASYDRPYIDSTLQDAGLRGPLGPPLVALPPPPVRLSPPYHAVGVSVDHCNNPPALETPLRIPGTHVRHATSRDSVSGETISLGMITISEENDTDCVRNATESIGAVGSVCTEDALLQMISTTLQLLESGKESDFCRSCAAFVQSARS